MRLGVDQGRGSSWTAEQSALAVKRNAEGWSASEIATELGAGRTRNAVIGHLHRKGIQKTRSPRAAPSGDVARKVEAARKRAAAKAAAPGLTRLALEARAGSGCDASAPSSGPIVPPIVVAIAPTVRAPLAALFDLGDSRCHWPVGNPGRPGFGFCGASGAALYEHRPYCGGARCLNYATTEL